MYERNGQPLEKILRNIIRVCFLRPKQRPYETNNFYAVLERQDRLDKEVYQIVNHKKPDKSRTQKIDAAIAGAKRQDPKHKSAQDSIPFERMFPDGICRVTENYYTKPFSFRTSTTSSARTRTKLPSLTAGVISSTTLMPRYIFS